MSRRVLVLAGVTFVAVVLSACQEGAPPDMTSQVYDVKSCEQLENTMFGAQINYEAGNISKKALDEIYDAGYYMSDRLDCGY